MHRKTHINDTVDGFNACRKKKACNKNYMGHKYIYKKIYIKKNKVWIHIDFLTPTVRDTLPVSASIFIRTSRPYLISPNVVVSIDEPRRTPINLKCQYSCADIFWLIYFNNNIISLLKDSSSETFHPVTTSNRIQQKSSTLYGVYVFVPIYLLGSTWQISICP